MKVIVLNSPGVVKLVGIQAQTPHTLAQLVGGETAMSPAICRTLGTLVILNDLYIIQFSVFSLFKNCLL